MLTLRRGTVVEADAPAGGWQRMLVDVAGERRPARGGRGDGGGEPGRRRRRRQRGRGRPRPRLGRLRRRPREPHPRPRRRRRAGRARDEAQLHQPPARRPPGGGRRSSRCRWHGRSPCSACTASSPRWRGRSGRRGRELARDTCRPREARCPARMSRVVPELRERELLAAPRHGGPGLRGRAGGDQHAGRDPLGAARRGLGCRAVPGPARGSSARPRRSDTAGCWRWTRRTPPSRSGCPTLVVARMSSGDPRDRHRGISHHTVTVLELAARPRRGRAARRRRLRAARRLPPRRARRGRRPRGLPAKRPARAHDGPRPRRGPGVLRRGPGRRHRSGGPAAREG